MKITNDFIGNETKTLTKTKISTILRWWGFNPDSYSTWGNARSDMNNILSDSSSSTISDRERASSFLSKINYINDTDTVIRDISFASNEAGVWYDPSDLSTLFQDSAGTRPVTAVEQPVGLMLDKSRGGRGTNLTPPTDQLSGWLGAVNNTLSNDGGGVVSTSTVNARVALRVANIITPGVYEVVVDVECGINSTASSTVRIAFSASTSFVGALAFPSSMTTVPGRGRHQRRCVISVTDPTHSGFLVGTNALAEINAGSWIKLHSVSVRRIDGNHASQATTTARPILSARYNLLVSTEDYNHGWIRGNRVSGSNVTCPDGRPGILLTKTDTTTGAHTRQGLGNSIVGATYSYQVAVYAGSANSVSFGIGATNDGSGVWGGTNTSVTKISGPGSVSSSSGIGVVTGLDSTVPTVVRVERTYVSSVIASVYVYPGTHNSSTEGHSVIVQDVDCRFAFDRINLPSYQRVGNLTTNPADYDAAGFAPYLWFDGVDDSLSTAPFSANSSICQVCVSLKKWTDASRGVVLEYGNNSNNSLLIDTGVSTSSHTPGPFIRLISRGTTSFSAGMVDVGGLPAPAMALLYGEASTTSNITRVFLNGSLSGEASGDQGGSDYAQSSLFIGSRNNSALRFSGRLYQTMLRFGATSGNIKNVFETQTRNARRSY